MAMVIAMPKIHKGHYVDDRGNVVLESGRALYSGVVLVGEEQVAQAEDHGWQRSEQQADAPLVRIERYLVQTKTVNRPKQKAGAK